MDWLRRNWPDLLIGLALIAVIAGIVATLLTGGSFFPLGGGGPTPPAAPAPSASAPAVPADPEPAGPDAADADDGAAVDGPSVAILPPAGSDAGDAADDASLAATPPGAPDPSTVEDGAPASAPGVTPVAPDGSTPSAGDDAPAAPDSAASAPPAPPAPAAPADPPAPADPSAPSDPPPTEPYRVSVGAFGLRANAETQARRFRDDGFPVFLGTQGELTLVLVGPYDRRADAEASAERIRQGDYDVDPIIYLFDPDGEVTDAPAPTPESTPAATPEPEAAIPASPEGVRLQVGAYGNRDGAAPMIERLEDLGFDVAVLDEDGLVKLVVGPFAGTALDDARIVLDGAGIDSFVR